MGKKAERIAYTTIETVLEQIGIVKFAKLFEEVVDDIGALEDGLDFASVKREQQFSDGIAKIIKARKGAERDAHEEDDEEFCDCCDPRLPCGCVQTEKRVNETVADFLARVQHWTGLHISINMALAEIMRVDFNVEKLVKKMRKCQNVGELVKLLTKKAGGQIRIRESKKGAEVPAYRSLVNNFPGFVVTTAK